MRCALAAAATLRQRAGEDGKTVQEIAAMGGSRMQTLLGMVRPLPTLPPVVLADLVRLKGQRWAQRMAG